MRALMKLMSFLKKEQSIPYAIPISKVDVLTSCNDLIDESCSNPCNERCYENVVVESCDDIITKRMISSSKK